MSELTDAQRQDLERLLAGDAGLREGLGPLLAGELGVEARDLVLRSLADRLKHGWEMRSAAVLALADALEVAEAGARGSQAGR